MGIFRRIHDWYITLGTRAAIADRECKHDGSFPRCTDCSSAAAGI